MTPEGEITGVRAVSHRETPGLGDEIDIAKSNWIKQFDGKSLGNPPLAGWAVKQDEGQFDAITGATVTPRAVIKAVKNTLLYFAAHKDELFARRRARGAAAGDGTGRTMTKLAHRMSPTDSGATTPHSCSCSGSARCSRSRRRSSTVSRSGSRRWPCCWQPTPSSSLMRKSLVPVVRIPLFVLIIASLVTSVDLMTNALLFELHEILGLFIPLIITNCAILAQAETVASRRPVGEAALSGVATGLGFCLVLVVLGAMREIFGSGTLFAGMSMLLGTRAEGLTIDLPFDGMLVAVLPPGAFFGLAVLLALRSLIEQRRAARRSARLDTSAAGKSRVNNAKRIEIYRRFAARNPHPTTELHYGSEFELLIAVVLSAQATDVERQQSHGEALRGRQHAGRDPRARRDGSEALHQDDWAVQQQGQEHHQDLQSPRRTP